MSFTQQFADTLALAPKPLDDNFEGNPARKPVSLPPLSGAPEFTYDETVPLAGSVSVTLKSIREPKFNVDYTVPRTDTVFAVKERLLSDPNGPLKDAKHTTDTLKLLVKAKVAPDTRQLAALSATQFTVMFIEVKTESMEVPLPTQVFWGDNNLPAANLPATTASEHVPKKPKSLPGVNNQFWKDVENVAKRYVEDPQALVRDIREQYQPFDLD